MKLRLGQTINSTDGTFGVLSDIVVDPVEKTVTHIVVEPTLGYYQSRLVPMWLVTDDETDELTVQLDEAHFRQLQRVAFSDHERLNEVLDIHPDWDIGTEGVVAPVVNAVDIDLADDANDLLGYSSVPRHECEVRDTSSVASDDGSVVGRVCGFLMDDDKVSALVVRVGVPGLRHDVLVPLDSIASVRSDWVELSIGSDEFFDLPRTNSSDDESSARPLERLRHTLETSTAKLDMRRRNLLSRR